jgi:hypothetical protein
MSRGMVGKRCACPPTFALSGQRLACRRAWVLVAAAGRAGPGGKRPQIRESGFATKHAAEERLAELVGQSAKGIQPPRRNVTFAAYSGGWLESRRLKVAMRPALIVACSSVSRVPTRSEKKYGP